MIDRQRVLRREQAVSGAINAVLSVVFFAIVFDLGTRPLIIGSPDRFALDFLPQGLMVSLMASLVPTVVVRAKLRNSGVPVTAAVGGIVGRGVLGGIATASVLAGLASIGPLREIPSYPALVLKVVYGALLGVACTRFAVVSLFACTMKEQAA